MPGSKSLLSLLAVVICGCNFVSMTAGGVGAKIAPSKAMENRGSPQKSKLIHGFLERLPGDAAFNAWVVVASLDNELVASVSAGRQGYYSVFVPPGAYRVTAYLDRDGDGVIYPHELAGQSVGPFTVPTGPDVAFFGLDIELGTSANAGFDGLIQVLDRAVPLDEGIPSIAAAEELYASQFGLENVELGAYQSTTAFFNHVSPIQHLDEVDLTTDRVPLVLVHGINDSPQVFREFEQSIPETHFEPLFFYYPTGARLPAMAELLYHLFFSGEVFPTVTRSVLIAHSMGGLVARGSLNYFSGRPGESTLQFYGSFVTPYGGVSAAEFGIKSGPFIVPSWIDVSPRQRYLTDLFQPLPPHLVFAMAHGNAHGSSDGVIALASQARKEALEQAQHVQVFPTTHVGIMSDQAAMATMLQWMQASLPPASAPGPLPIAPRVGNLELRHRAHALRSALHGKFEPRGLRVFVSLITPTVARLRVANMSTSVIFHLSVGQGIRVDERASVEPLLLDPWPEDASALDAVAARVAVLAEARLQAADVPSGRPAVPLVLQFRPTLGRPRAVQQPEQITKFAPPPVALGSGLAFSINADGRVPQVQIPIKMDGYFGYFGMGLDLRYSVWSGLIDSDQANILFQPIAVTAGPRVRFGHRSAPFTGQLGVNGGVELGDGVFLQTDADRLYEADEVLDRRFLALPVVYGSFGVGLRIFEDFYGIALGDLGVRFPPKSIELPDDATLHLQPSGIIRGALGVEVRLP